MLSLQQQWQLPANFLVLHWCCCLQTNSEMQVRFLSQTVGKQKKSNLCWFIIVNSQAPARPAWSGSSNSKTNNNTSAHHTGSPKRCNGATATILLAWFAATCALREHFQGDLALPGNGHDDLTSCICANHNVSIAVSCMHWCCICAKQPDSASARRLRSCACHSLATPCHQERCFNQMNYGQNSVSWAQDMRHYK